MDFCTEVVQNPKRAKYCFELHMCEGHKSFTLAAENDAELQDWLTKLHSVLQQNKLQEDKRAASLERGLLVRFVVRLTRKIEIIFFLTFISTAT